MQHDLAARPPRGRVHAPGRCRHLALRAALRGHGPYVPLTVAGGHERDVGVVGRPARHRVLGRVGRQLPQRPAGKLEDPDVVVAAQRVAAIGRERDARSVVRPHRLTVVEGALGELALVRSVGSDRPQVVAAVAIGEKGDGAPIGRPGRLARVVEHVGDARGRAAGGRERPDAALEIDGQRAAIGRDRHRHRRAFRDRDVDGGGGRHSRRARRRRLRT